MKKKLVIRVCPFCGRHEQRMFSDGTWKQVECGYCGARGPTSEDVREAVDLWNDIFYDLAANNTKKNWGELECEVENG